MSDIGKVDSANEGDSTNKELIEKEAGTDGNGKSDIQTNAMPPTEKVSDASSMAQEAAEKEVKPSKEVKRIKLIRNNPLFDDDVSTSKNLKTNKDRVASLGRLVLQAKQEKSAMLATEKLVDASKSVTQNTIDQETKHPKEGKRIKLVRNKFIEDTPVEKEQNPKKRKIIPIVWP